MIRFFWSRKATLWLSIVYVILGLILMIFPGLSGRVFCWGLAAGALAYAAGRFWQYAQEKKRGYPSGGSLILGALFTVLGLLCLLKPTVILSILPVTLGLVLLVDGLGKLPLAVDAWKTRFPHYWSILASCLLPLVLGIVLLFNPFGVVKTVIFFFGLSLMLDGVFDLLSALYSRSGGPDPL